MHWTSDREFWQTSTYNGRMSVNPSKGHAKVYYIFGHCQQFNSGYLGHKDITSKTNACQTFGPWIPFLLKQMVANHSAQAMLCWCQAWQPGPTWVMAHVSILVQLVTGACLQQG
eukprot:scaffold188755_cov19-Tisochrysis_lutea.AAC.1